MAFGRQMNESTVVTALLAVGERLAWESPELDRVEIVVIGGAAGMLLGALAADRTTADCDVLHWDPPSAQSAVLAAALAVAEQFGLSDQWLNTGGTPWGSGLPEGWHARTREVLRSGPLIVRAIDRIDLMMLKLLAGRPQDIEDLEVLRMTTAEASLLRRHLVNWTDDSWPRGMIDEAIALLDALDGPVPASSSLRDEVPAVTPALVQAPGRAAPGKEAVDGSR